jgi:phage terminase small subunit
MIVSGLAVAMPSSYHVASLSETTSASGTPGAATSEAAVAVISKESAKKSAKARNQQRFVAEYLTDLNATRAAIAAGYSKKSAECLG